MSGQVYSEPFAQIPEWVIDSDVSDRAIRVFAILHRHANKAGFAFPGRAKLAARARCSTASLDRALNELRLIGAMQSRQRKENGGVIGNDYWLWPAVPSSSVSTPSLTGEATPGRVGEATLDSRVTQQEEREPVNESQSSSSGAEPQPSSTGEDDPKEKKDRVPVTEMWFNPYRAYSERAAFLAYERRVATIGPPAHPARWRRHVSDQWARDNWDRLAELVDGQDPPLGTDEVVAWVEMGDSATRSVPTVVGCDECGFSGWHDTGQRSVIRCTVTA